jgi:hypothetical protein
VDFERAAIDMAEMAQTGVVYLRTNLPLIEFTKSFQGVLEIYGEKKVLSIDLSTETELATIAYLLTTIFDEKVVVLSWDIKQLVTYFKFHLAKNANFKFAGKVIDLRLIEAFLGLSQPAPESLRQAIKRMSSIKDNTKARLVHSKIHNPLFLEVIPSMEVQGVLHTDIKKRVYPYYEIEGSVNGRLQSSKPFPVAINTHGLTDFDKERLKLASDEEAFLQFDFSSMEVAVLQYLSGDPVLAEALATGDCYKSMWSMLFSSPCDKPEQRKLIKNCFLPLVFGMGIPLIVSRTGCSENAASVLSKGFRGRFKKAFEYVESYQGNVTAVHDFENAVH